MLVIQAADAVRKDRVAWHEYSPFETRFSRPGLLAVVSQSQHILTVLENDFKLEEELAA